MSGRCEGGVARPAPLRVPALPIRFANPSIIAPHERPDAGRIPFAPPAHVARHLVAGVESAAREQTFRQPQRHRRVVGSVASAKAERPAAHHAGNRREGAGR